MKLFVDTNIFIYTLFDRYPKKQIKCVSLFKDASMGKISLWTTELVIAEIIWFLKKQGFTWLNTKDIITKIISSKGLEVRSKNQILEALEMCLRNEDFIDAINVSFSQAEGIDRGCSYDKGFDKWTSFKRLEP